MTDVVICRRHRTVHDASVYCPTCFEQNGPDGRPRLRLHKGRWLCGRMDQHPNWWATAFTPEEAYSLWKRCQKEITGAAAVPSAATT